MRRIPLAIHQPPMPPTNESITLSTSSCRTMRQRPAPSAMRTEISRDLPIARASRRFCLFAINTTHLHADRCGCFARTSTDSFVASSLRRDQGIQVFADGLAHGLPDGCFQQVGLNAFGVTQAVVQGPVSVGAPHPHAPGAVLLDPASVPGRHCPPAFLADVLASNHRGPTSADVFQQGLAATFGPRTGRLAHGYRAIAPQGCQDRSMLVRRPSGADGQSKTRQGIEANARE